MRIGIDATSANKSEKTGVEWYAYHLIQNLKEVTTGNDQVVLYTKEGLQGDLGALPDNWRSRILRWPFARGWNTCRLSWEMWRRPPDLLFVPAQKLPPICPKRTVTTIHDIGPDRVSHVYHQRIASRVKKTTKIAAKKATKIITVSEFTKNELSQVYKVALDRIKAIPLAADLHRYKQLEQNQVSPVLQKYRLGRSFFFHVGRLESKKNIITLIQAFDHFKTGRGLGDPYLLVLAGQPGFGYSKIKEFISASKAKDSIRLLGHVSEDDLPALINVASAYLFPSWYEGFGIPAVESLACGTPLIASDIGALHEVAGDAAVFVKPKEPQRWAEAMKKLVTNGPLRDQLVENGLARSKEFSWKKTAQATWHLFQETVASDKNIHLEKAGDKTNFLE